MRRGAAGALLEDHGELPARGFRGRDHAVDVREAERRRLLDNHVGASCERLLGPDRVAGRGSAEVHDVEVHVRERGRRERDAVLRGEGRGPVGVDVDRDDNLRVIPHRDRLGVQSCDVARADDGCAHSRHGVLVPS